MRTTVTLDDDVVAQLKRVMKSDDLGFKEALNRALRRGLEASPPRPRRRYRVRSFDTGEARVSVDKVGLSLSRSW